MGRQSASPPARGTAARTLPREETRRDQPELVMSCGEPSDVGDVLLLHASGTSAIANPRKIQMAKAEKPRGMRDIVGSFGLTGPIAGSIARSIPLSSGLFRSPAPSVSSAKSGALS